MAQNYRIYINENVLVIGKTGRAGKENKQTVDSQNFDFKTFFEALKKGGKKEYRLITKDPKSTFKKLKRSLKIVRAAGGLVENGMGEHLFIFRNGKWDLPKGKAEKGEKLKTTGVREVEEECGLSIDKYEGKLCKTWHIYSWDGKLILKRTNWYRMRVKGKPKLKPQKEEGITSAVWVVENKIKNKAKNTYPLILDVLKAGKIL